MNLSPDACYAIGTLALLAFWYVLLAFGFTLVMDWVQYGQD